MEGKAVDARWDGCGSQPTGQTEVAGVVGVYFVYFCAAWFSRIQFSVFTYRFLQTKSRISKCEIRFMLRLSP